MRFLFKFSIFEPKCSHTNFKTMKNILFLLAILTVLPLGSELFSQSELNCYERLEKAFEERGSYQVSDDIHRNVFVVFLEDGDANCIKGKARVVNGVLQSVFVYYDDNTSELYVEKPLTQNKESVGIKNGISDVIRTRNNERIVVVFIDSLKPKQKEFKKATLPSGL